MTNNDIIRRIRYIFDFNDYRIIAIFALAEVEVTRELISNWLKKDEDPAYQACNDIMMATFLNGLILEYLETIPEAGTGLKIDGYAVEILQTAGNAVRTARVIPPGPAR